MARTTPTAPRRTGWSLIPPALTLALWRLGTTWRLLLTAGLGILAAVVLVAAVPLFSLVATSAGLRGALANDPAGDGITVVVHTAALSANERQQVQNALFPVMQRDLGTYLTGNPIFSVQTSSVPLATVARHPATTGDGMSFWGVNTADAAPHLSLVTGRLPAGQGTGLEIAISQSVADLLRVHVGDSFTFVTGNVASKGPTARVVGIFVIQNPTDTYWRGEDFTPHSLGQQGTDYVAIADADALMAFAAQVPASTNGGNAEAALTWHYALDFSRLTADNLTTVVNQFNALRVEGYNSLTAVQNVQFVEFNSGIEALTNFQTRIFVLQIPITLLLLQVLALVIFFVSLMADIVIDRQTEAIAVLRSRGASRRQIFGALAVQTGGLAIIAAIVGPLLAIAGVRLVASHSLVASDQSALNILTGNPFALVWDIRWYILIAVLSAFAAMLIAINRAMDLDVLALRREAARTTRRPLWQRLNLDIVFALIGVTGYASYVIGVQRLSPRVQSVLSPLSLIAPFFLLFATALLFLRFFPSVLQAAARLAGRGRRAEPMLALAQMARAPRQSLRTTLLLALTTAFTIFTLVFVASQNQHTLDTAAFAVGADFNGTLPAATAASNPAPKDQAAQYAVIPGVTSATIGYQASISAQTDVAGLQVTLDAVDADTYAQTAVWNTTNSAQPLAALMQTLRDNRAQATTQDIVPAIVDDAMWQTFHLDRDPHFTLSVPGYNTASLHLIAVGHVTHIAGIYDTPGFYDLGGVLADFASYATVYQHDTGTTLQQNFIWLRTRDDAASLASVRAALTGTNNPLRLTNVTDRRDIITNAARDPLVIDLLGILVICAVTAATLGILGALVASWLSARNRLTNFAVLRALGSDPTQTARVLIWEQSIITVTALVLGLGLGVILAGAILPTLIFTNLIARQNVFLGATNVPPIQTIIPFGAVGLVIGGVALIFIVMLALMTRIVARPSISQTLRLNED